MDGIGRTGWHEVVEARLAAMNAFDQRGRPFHWPVEFPEVFSRPNPGFDAVVGNPPFLGGSLLSDAEGKTYVSWLLEAFEPAHGKSDLVAFFFRRAFSVVRLGGAMAFISTKTIRQGQTRTTSLEFITEHGGVIERANRRKSWPGEANVIVSTVQVRNGLVPDVYLDDKRVDRITSFLMPFGPNSSPRSLLSNREIAFSGINPNGKGFVLSAGEYTAMVSGCPECRDFIKPYLSSDDLNGTADAAPSRHIADVGQLSEGELSRLVPLYEHLRDTVRLERQNSSEKRLREEWWKYSRPAASLRERAVDLKRVLVMGRLATHHTIAFQAASSIFSDALTIFLFDKYFQFATLQSRVHEVWAKFFGSSFKDDPRYIPEECFENFPMPDYELGDRYASDIGSRYYELRANAMLSRKMGMTELYNKFNELSDPDSIISEIREVHLEMDRAVLMAYGWRDLAESVTQVTLTPEVEDDPFFVGRLSWPLEFRDQVLARLLTLNQERSHTERAAGVASVSRERAKGRDTSDLTGPLL